MLLLCSFTGYGAPPHSPHLPLTHDMQGHNTATVQYPPVYACPDAPPPPTAAAPPPPPEPEIPPPPPPEDVHAEYDRFMAEMNMPA